MSDFSLFFFLERLLSYLLHLLRRYFEHIKQPMDISTMSHKLDAGMYPDRFAFKDDFKLMIANCYLFNGTESLPGKLAHTFDVYFDKQWERASATLEQLRIKAGFAAAAQDSGRNTNVTTSQEPAPSAPSASQAHATLENASEVPRTPSVPPIAQALSSGPKPFALKLKLSSSNTNAQPSPLQPSPNAGLPTEPTKPLDDRLPSVGPAASPRETSRAPSLAREPSRGASGPGDSRSSSPNLPLSVVAPAAIVKPKITFKAKPKAEPVEDNELFVAPLPPVKPAPPPPPQTAPSTEAAAPPKPKKIRLSIGGNAGLTPSARPPSASPVPVPAPAQTVDAGPGRNGSHPPPRAQSVSSANGDPNLPVNVKKMTALMKKIMSMDESYFFRRPVDPVADGCPT